MISYRRALLLFAVLGLVGFAWAAFANLIQSRTAGEAVFDNAGAPWPFFSQVAAINYDKGGQGLGYNVPTPDPTDCPNGSGYRTDAVNFITSTAGAPAIPFQIGCSQSPNSWNYTINISQSGPYQITLQLSDTSAGGSWNVMIDGVIVTTVSTPNTGSFNTFASSTSGPFSATLGNHKLTLAWGAGDAAFAGNGDILTWQGSKAPVTTISSVAMSCGSTCSFVGGTAGTVGTAQATMSSGSFTGTWSLRTSSADNFGTTCNNYGSGFTINSSTGVVSNGAIASGSYPGVCLVATQAGAGGSPFAQAVTFTGSNSAPGEPAPAIAAGFNTLAMNEDFKDAAHSNKATFINECGSTAQLRWYWVLYLTTTPLSCNDFTVTSDGAALPQVLHISVPVGEIPPAQILDGNGASFGFPGYAYTSSSPCNKPCFPNEMYVEVKWRTTFASWNQDGNAAHGAHYAFNTAGDNIQSDGSKPTNSNQELDVFETSGGPGASPQFHGQLNGLINGSEFFGGEVFWNSDATQYHTTAALVTSNGTNTYSQCSYLDGVKQGSCQTTTAFPSGVFSQHDNPLYFTIDTFNNFSPIVPLELWIDHVTVWECASWQTTSCPGNLVQ